MSAGALGAADTFSLEEFRGNEELGVGVSRISSGRSIGQGTASGSCTRAAYRLSTSMLHISFHIVVEKKKLHEKKKRKKLKSSQLSTLPYPNTKTPSDPTMVSIP